MPINILPLSVVMPWRIVGDPHIETACRPTRAAASGIASIGSGSGARVGASLNEPQHIHTCRTHLQKIFSSERSASAFNRCKLRTHLVCSFNMHRDPRNTVEVKYVSSNGEQSPRRCLRCGNCDRYLIGYRSKQRHENIDGATTAYAEHSTRHKILECFCRDGELQGFFARRLHTCIKVLRHE